MIRGGKETFRDYGGQGVRRTPGRQTGTVLAAVLLLGVVGCGVVSPDDAELERLNRAQARWAGHGPSRYAVTVDLLCFCPLVTARLTVEDGVVVEVSFPEGANGGPPEPWWYDHARNGLPTVEAAFPRIRDALRKGPDYFEADYRRTDGLPLSVSVDPIRGAADDEWTLRYRDLESLEGADP